MGFILDWFFNSFLGDLPTWITAFAIIFAFFQFRNDNARRRDEVRANQRAEERESQEQARQLTSWVVSTKGLGDEKPHYGVLISNTSGSMFFNTTIDVLLHKEATKKPLKLHALPPGQFFVEYSQPGNPFPWAFPAPVSDDADTKVTPYMNTPGYRVTSMRFTDTYGQAWTRDENGILAHA